MFSAENIARPRRVWCYLHQESRSLLRAFTRPLYISYIYYIDLQGSSAGHPCKQFKLRKTPPPPIVDQLYDDVPTLKSIPACLNSLRVVSPGVQRRKSTRKDPVTQTESPVLTRLPPRTTAHSVSIQWSCVVKP